MDNISTEKYAIIQRSIMGFYAYFSILSPSGWSLFSFDATRFPEDTAYKIQKLLSEPPSIFSYIVLTFPKSSDAPQSSSTSL